MHLYQGTSEQFIADAVQARLANQLAERFFEEFRYKPAPSEVTSWRNSLARDGERPPARRTCATRASSSS